jgi:hypothetical protein
MALPHLIGGALAAPGTENFPQRLETITPFAPHSFEATTVAQIEKKGELRCHFPKDGGWHVLHRG